MSRLNPYAPPDPDVPVAEDFDASETNIDPKRVDVLDKPKRRAKRRKAGAMPDRLKPWVEDAKERAEARPASPGVMLEPRGGTGWTYTSPHDDLDAWSLQLADAFGTRSESTMRVFLSDLKSLCSQAWDSDNQRWKPNERELNAALNIVNGMRPENEMQAAMAAQMVAMHWLGMKLGQKALANPYDNRTVASTSRIMRAYAGHAVALHRLQGKAAPREVNQNITVRHETHIYHHSEEHRHVHLEGGAGDFGGQPDAKTGSDVRKLPATCGPSGCAALPSPTEARSGALSITSGEGSEGVPDAWWRPRIRRGEGAGERVLSARGVDG